MDKPSNISNARGRSFRIILTVGALGVVLIGALVVSGWLGDSMVRRHAPLVDASMEIKMHLALFHLWLEEHISGDISVPSERFWEHLDEAEWYAQAMLEGGVNPEGEFVRTDDEALREELRHVQGDIRGLRAITEMRLDIMAGIGTPEDKSFDEAFLRVLGEADHVEEVMLQLINREQQQFRFVTGALFLIAVILTLSAGLVLVRYERRRAADFGELALSREDLRVTLNSLGDGVVSTDRDGTILRINPQAEDLSGWSETEAAGKPFDEVFRFIDENTREALESPIAYVIETGWPTDLPKNSMIVSRDGTLTPVDDATTPVFSPDGKLRGAVIVFRDATGQREFERYLERFKFVMDNSGEEFYLINPDGEITYANAAAEKSLGYPGGGLVGMLIGDIDPNMHGERYEEYYAMLEDIDPGPFETEHVCSDGRVIEKEIRYGRIDYFGEGYACAIARDITERKEMERVRKDFYSMVTHDLKSPMTTLLGYLDLIDEQKSGSFDTETREMLGFMKTGAYRVYRLINDFLTLSRLETGSATLDTAPVSPGEVASKLFDEYRTRAQSAGLEYTSSIQDGLPNIMADRTQLERALGNLIENALNYTPEGGSVTVGAETGGEGVSFFVSDTGPGVDPEDRDRIFSKYYRAKKTLKTKGTGLGLAIVDVVARAHGGRVELDSEPGRGARFAIVLPAG